MTETLLVTGAAGQLGRGVVEALLDMGAGPIIATTRDPSKLAEFAARGVDVRAADFDEPSSLSKAFNGAGRLLLISTDAVLEPGQRLKQHRAAIAAADSAGVEHIVYTSVPSPRPSLTSAVDDDHFWTEQAIVASRMSWTIMRHALYQDLLLHSLPQAIATGHLATATGNMGRHLVTRDDCARADAAALASSDRTNRIYEVTGPAAVAATEIAEIVTNIAGRSVKHLAVDSHELKEGIVGAGMPERIADMLTGFDEAAAQGFYATLTNVVRDLTGREPTSVASFLDANREALVAL